MSTVTESTGAVMNQSERTFLQKNGQKLFAVAVWLVIFAAYFFWARSQELGLGESFRVLLNNLTAVLTGPIGPLVYIGLYVLRPILFFPAVPLTIVGGALFGPIGILWVIIGSNMSAMLAYVIGRFFGEGVLESDGDSEGFIQRYAQRMRDNSFETVLIMRFVYVPYDLVNYLSGLLKIDWKPFITATALGSIVGTVVFTLIGAAFENLDAALTGEVPSINPWTLALSAVLFVASIALSRYFKRRESTNTAQ